MLNALLCWAVGYLTAIVFSLMVVLPYSQKGSHKRSSAKGTTVNEHPSTLCGGFTAMEQIKQTNRS